MIVRSTIALFALWLVLTGGTAPGQLVLGLVLAVALAYWVTRVWSPTDGPPPVTRARAHALVLLGPLLLFDVIRGAFQVAVEVLRPQLAIEPVVVEKRTGLQRELSRVVYANSVTLAPGTMTVDSEGDTVRIHCLSDAFSISITEGTVEDRIARALERRPE